MIKILLFFVACSFNYLNVNAQYTSYNFSALSNNVYKDKIALLEKYKVPKIYSDKESQAWYDEILGDRNKAILSLFKENDVVYDTLLLNKCNSIAKRIAAANKNYNLDTIQFYINRSLTANAACYGEGTVMVNLGLFLWIDNDDELALVLAHEISHQLLNHGEERIKKTITTFTSEDFKKELKDIKKADYGKYERFKKLMKDINVDAGKHSTYKESEADKLAVTLIKNAGYNIEKASIILLKLDNVDDIFKSNKLYNLKEIIEKAPIDLSHFNIKRKYNGLSGVSVTMNADKDFDSIKTHPDCKKRYETIAAGIAAPTTNCCTSFNDLYNPYKESALYETVRNLYEGNALTYCIHVSFMALQKGYNSAFYKYILSLCFSRMYYNDKNLKRFNSINVEAERNTNLKELQDYLFNINTEDINALSLYFLNNTGETTSEDYSFASAAYQAQVVQKDAVTIYTSFAKKFPNSKYYYLIKPKIENEKN